MADTMPRTATHHNCYIIAGPNGAGKTTFATKFLPLYARCQNFINPDLLARAGALDALSETSSRFTARCSTRCIFLTILPPCRI